ncbi:hypothetical protein D3C71_1057800 [compost metagenome]
MPNNRGMDTKHPDSDIIDDLGGTAAVARLCKVKDPSVSEWRKTGIPDARRMFLEAIRPGAFKRTADPAPAQQEAA